MCFLVMTRVLIAADSGFSFAGCVLEIGPAQQCGSWWFMPWGLYELRRRCWGKREGAPHCLTFVFSPFPSLQTVPKPIALEPCFGNKAAVLSVFVRLPRGLGGIPPPGQSGEDYCCLSWLGINSVLLPQPYRVTFPDPTEAAVATGQLGMCLGYFSLPGLGPAGLQHEL